MTKIFLSHSKLDKEILNYFDTIVARIEGISSFRASLESFPIVESPAETITNAIKQSVAVFVLLGKGMLQSQYTMSWVGYEVGFANALAKEVWVFELQNEIIDFPTPHVDHYILYSMDEWRQFIRELLEAYESGPLGLQRPLLLFKRLRSGKNVLCSQCWSSFKIYQDFRFICKCPACRNNLDSTYLD